MRRLPVLLVLLLLVAGELRWGWVTVIPAEPYVWHVDAPFDTGAHPPANWQQWVTSFWDRGPLPLPGTTILHDRTPPLNMGLETWGVLWDYQLPACTHDDPPCPVSPPADLCAQELGITFPMTDEATRQRYFACAGR
jgi:hypothetical protein